MNSKKTILLFVSDGGGGHRATGDALKALCEHDYTIIERKPITEVGQSLDLIQRLTLGRLDSEQLYNHLIKKKWIRISNFCYALGKRYYSARKKSLLALIEKEVNEIKPDLIVSIAPLCNGAIAHVAQAQQIPFLLMPTDLDPRSFLVGFSKERTGPFACTLAFDDPIMKEMLEAYGIKNEEIIVTGLALRPQFFLLAQKTDDRPPIAERPLTILLMMGAVGGNNLYEIARKISTIQQPIELIICIGKNEGLRKRLETITMPQESRMQIVSFTENIASLMAFADIMVTKSGTLSLCEAIQSSLPVLLDATSKVICWEQFNHQFVKKYEIGYSFESLRELKELITNLAMNKQKIEQLKNNMQSFKRTDLSLLKATIDAYAHQSPDNKKIE